MATYVSSSDPSIRDSLLQALSRPPGKRDPDEMNRYASMLMEDNPDDWLGWYSYGCCDIVDGEYASAIGFWTTAFLSMEVDDYRFIHANMLDFIDSMFIGMIVDGNIDTEGLGKLSLAVNIAIRDMEPVMFKDMLFRLSRIVEVTDPGEAANLLEVTTRVVHTMFSVTDDPRECLACCRTASEVYDLVIAKHCTSRFSFGSRRRASDVLLFKATAHGILPEAYITVAEHSIARRGEDAVEAALEIWRDRSMEDLSVHCDRVLDEVRGYIDSPYEGGMDNVSHSAVAHFTDMMDVFFAVLD